MLVEVYEVERIGKSVLLLTLSHDDYLISRCQEKPLGSESMPVPQTDTGR